MYPFSLSGQVSEKKTFIQRMANKDYNLSQIKKKTNNNGSQKSVATLDFLGFESYKSSAILSGATTKASCINPSGLSAIQNSLKGTIIGSDTLFSSGIYQKQNQVKNIANQIQKMQKQTNSRDSANKLRMFKTVNDSKSKKKLKIKNTKSADKTKSKFVDTDDLPTEKKIYVSNLNPHLLKRRDQQNNDYVWLAVYDEDMINNVFLNRILNCSNQTLPLEFQSLEIQQYEIVFQEPNFVYVQRKKESQMFAKVFLITFSQLIEIIVAKNQTILGQDSQLDQVIVQTQIEHQQYELKMLNNPTSYLPLDQIFCIGKHDYLPIFTFSNKDKAQLDGRISRQPSFLKHIGSSQMDISYLSMIFQGLKQSFPQIPQQQLFTYLTQRPGINQNLTLKQLNDFKMPKLKQQTNNLLNNQQQKENNDSQQDTLIMKFSDKLDIYEQYDLKDSNEKNQTGKSALSDDYQHSLFKNKIEMTSNQNTSNAYQLKNQNILSSLTKGEIEDPFQIRNLNRNETSRAVNTNHSSKNNQRILQSIQRSPQTSDRNGVCIVNRQEADFIKKIDFKQTLLDSLNQSQCENININISNLIDDQLQSPPEYSSNICYDCNESESVINMPQQIQIVPFHQRQRLEQQQPKEQIYKRQLKRIPLKDIKNTVINSIINKQQSVSSKSKRMSQCIKGMLSGESSQNISPIKAKLDEQSSCLQVEEYSNISDISYSNNEVDHYKQLKQISLKQKTRKKLSSNFTGPGLRIQASSGGSLLCPSNGKNSLVQFKHNNKENILDKQNMQSDRHFTSTNSKQSGSLNNRNNTTMSLNKNGNLSSGRRLLLSGQKTETFLHEIKSILDVMNV